MKWPLRRMSTLGIKRSEGDYRLEEEEELERLPAM